MEKKDRELQKDKDRSSVPTGTIVTIVISFFLGVIVILLFLNFLGKEQMMFSTYSILSFAFTAGLGTASIVLALIAIKLSRDSEETLIHRSEEGIRLQNEVFMKTNDVLSKVQTSTGVTEKRIEDIIAGRASIIVNEAIEKSLPKESRDFSKENIDKIKKEIAGSLKEQLDSLLSATPSRAVEMLDEKAARQRKIEETNEKWHKFRESVMEKLRINTDVKLVSEASGNILSEEPSKFWDAILEIKGKRVGLDFHTAEQVNSDSGFYAWKVNQNARSEFLRRITWRMQQDNIPLVFIILDNDIWEQPGLNDLVKKIDDFHSINSKFNIIRIFGEPGLLVEQILGHFKNK